MHDKHNSWAQQAAQFLKSICTSGGAVSVLGGDITLYGTCYAFLGLYYLGEEHHLSGEIVSKLILSSQEKLTGLFEGPELKNYLDSSGRLHDRQHLMLHQTCSAALPVLQLLKIRPKPIYLANDYCNTEVLKAWQDNIEWKNAWIEGNNILFIGQLLIYLRDFEFNLDAGVALKIWFDWLDELADPITGLWGTNGFCSPMEAVYGGYHQLLIYYHENHPIPNICGLVETVLSLQHVDGGFNPNSNSGACEDVDSVDILVNCYKRTDYRRPEIRYALRRCLKHILSTQNPDGGFPYNRGQAQSHMGIPATEAPPNVSCTFPTWFRIHTLALIAEILPNEPALKGIKFRFNTHISMGWHASPPGWIPISDAINLSERRLALVSEARSFAISYLRYAKKLKRLISRFI